MKKAIVAVIAASLKPALKEAGFKKDGLNFRRERAGAIDLVHVESVASAGAFFVKAGVYYEALDGERGVASPIANAELTVRKHFGRRPADAHGAPDESWKLTWPEPDQKEIDDVAAELREVWTARIAPWFASVQTPEHLHHLLETSEEKPEDRVFFFDLLAPVRVALLAGDHAAAQRRLDVVLASIHKTRAERLQQFGPRDPFGSTVIKNGAALAKAHGLIVGAPENA